MRTCTMCPAPIDKRNRSGKCRSCVGIGRPNVTAWPQDEVERLRRLWPLLGKRCADQFPNRTPTALQTKAQALGIRCEAKQVPHNKPPKDATEHMQRAARQASAQRKRSLDKAIVLARQGVVGGTVKHGQTRLAMVQAVQIVEEEKRQACPIEQAKTVVRTLYPGRPAVHSMSVWGGPANLYRIGAMLNVSEQDLLALADKYRERAA